MAQDDTVTFELNDILFSAFTNVYGRPVLMGIHEVPTLQ